MSEYTLYLIASGSQPSTVADEVVRLTERSPKSTESIVSDRGVVASGVSAKDAETMLEALHSAGAVVMRLPEAVCDVPDGLPLRLRVVDAEGEPVNGADVLVRTPDEAFNEAVPTITTSKGGRAVVKDFTTIIDEHFDEWTGLPPVWFEVSREDESFEFTGSEFTDWEAFRDGEMRTYEVQVRRESDDPSELEDSEKQPDSKEPSDSSDGEYVVEGHLELESYEPAGKYTVVAYDRDLTGAQRLGESTTGDDGGYRISYDASAFRQDEAGSSDLRLRVFTASGRELSVDVIKPDVPTVRGEQILFDAGPKETVHLRLVEPVSTKAAELSRYEKALGRIAEAAGEEPLHTLSAEDQVFLHHDTDVSLKEVAFVVEDARLRQKTGMPEGVFFGLGVKGIGVVSEEEGEPPTLDLALLREHAVDELVSEVETAIEEHTIPPAVEQQINKVRAQFETLRAKGPTESRATRRRHMSEVGRLTGLDDATADKLSRHFSGPDASDETWTQLVNEGVLSEAQVPSVKRAVEVDGITQNHLPLTKAVLDGNVPQIDGTIESTKELARLDASDWKTVLEENEVMAPEGYDRQTYAEAVEAQVEVRHPTTFLAYRTTRRDRQGLSDELRRVQSNVSIEDGLFTDLAGSSSADVSDLEADTSLDVVDEIRDLTAFARTFRQLEVPRLLDDPELSVDEKVEEIDRRIQAVDMVFGNNADKDLLCVDVLDVQSLIPREEEISDEEASDEGEESDDDELSVAPTLTYEGINDDLQPLVRRQMQEFQRALTLTGRAREAVSLLRDGYDSAHSIARKNRSVFTEQVDLADDRAETIYDEATTSAEHARYRLGSVLGEMLRHRMPLPSDNTDDRVVNTLKELDGFEEILGGRVGCDCEHCRSIFGPLAYFVDLMQFVEQHVIDEHFASVEDHPLDPRTRRPDLWDGVSLTCDNATEMVPYLQIVVEVLSAFIARDEGTDTSGLDRSGVVQAVFDELREGDRSFDQPFNLPYEEMLHGLDRLNLDAATVAATVGAGGVVTARMRLGLSPEDVETITTSIANDTAELRRRYGIPSGESLDTLDVRSLMQATGLDREEVDRLVELDFVDGPRASGPGLDIETVMGDAGLRPEAQKLKGLTTERLDRLFRLVRLQRALPWSLETVNHALYALKRVSGASEATIDKRVIRDLAAIRRLQGELDASVSQVFAVVDRIPTDPTDPDARSLFDRLFNKEAFVDENGALDASAPTDFWHPPYDDGSASGEERDPNLPRLLEALGVSEKIFNALMETLKGQLQPTEHPTSGRHYVELSLENLSMLYRHAFLLNQLNLSVGELDAALRMVQSERPAQNRLSLGAWPHGSNSADEPVVQSLLGLIRWIRGADLSVLDAASTALDSPPTRDDPIRTFTSSKATDLANEAESRVTFRTADIIEQVDLPESVVEKALTALTDANYLQDLQGSSQSGPWRLTASYDASTFPGGLGLDPDVRSELTDAKETALRRALNQYLPETHVTEVLTETLDVTSARLRQLMRLATGTTPFASEQVLTRTQALTLSSPAEPSSDQIERQLDILEPLDDIYLAADRLSLGDAALETVLNEPSVFDLSPGDRNLVTREPLRRLARFHRLRQESSAPEAIDALLEDPSVDADYSSLTSDDQEDLANRLATVAGAGQDLADSVLGALSMSMPSPRPDRVATLIDAVELARTLETTGTGLALFGDSVYNRIKQARDVVYSALYARYEEAEERKAALEPLRERIRERQRDVLMSHLTAQPALQLDTPKDIYYYFLLDPEMSGCARTSRVVAATGSLQLYVNRCLMNLEQEAEGRTAEEDSRIHVKPSDIPDDEWEWRKKYRVWEANRKVFLYPENYLEPGLRSDTTEPFEKLQDRLLQEDLDDATARKLYREYLDAFGEVADLRIAGHYFDPASSRSDSPAYEQRAGTLYLVGRTPSDPRRFYLRTRTLEAKKNGYTETWSNWSRIEMDIQADEVSPIIFRNRLYLFWVESTTKPWREGSGEDGKLNGYRHSIKLKFIRQTAKGQWTSPQEMELPSALRTVNDRLGRFRPKTNHSDQLIQKRKLEKRKLGEDWVVPELQKYHSPRHTEQHPDYPNATRVAARDDYTLDHKLYNRIFPFVQNDTLYFQYGVEEDVYSINVNEQKVSTPNDDPDLLSDPTETLRVQKFELYDHPLQRSSIFRDLYFGRNRQWGDYMSHYYEAERARLSKLELEYHEPGGYNTLKGNDSTPMDKAGEVLPSTGISSVNNAPHLFVLEHSEGAALIERTSWERLKATRLRTATAEALQEILIEGGLWEMLSVDTQQQLQEPNLIGAAARAGIIATGSTRVSLRSQPAHSFLTYLWEVFFHAPLLIAHTLNGRDRFEQAERWYNVIFDPMGEEVYESRPGGGPTKEKEYHPGDRNWRFTGFHGTETPVLSKLLGDDSRAFQAYLEDPFDPFAVADARPLAYQRYVLMAYVDNLLDWGDDLFAQDTRESINEATLLYVTAADVLGQRPVSLGECPKHGDGATYDELNTEETFLVTAENLVRSAGAANRSTCRRHVPDLSTRVNGRGNGAVGRRGSAGTSPPVFCVPRNEELIGYWDRVEDRLYKIRHCMNLEGVRRTLSLFEPPIEPDLLVRAQAAGLSVEEVVGAAEPEMPQYRFRYLFSKAKEYVSTVRSFGNALQAALEKKDAEELKRMRTLHAKNLEEMKTEIRNKQIEEAEAKLNSLDEQKNVLLHRQTYYGEKKRTNAQEKAATVLTDVAMGLHTAASVVAAAAPPQKATPQIQTGVSGIGGFATVEIGGEQTGGLTQAIAQVLRDSSSLSNMASSRMKTQARYERRKEDWDFQAESASKQLTKLKKDRAVAEFRKQIAERELELHEKKKDQTAEVYDFYEEKLTDLDLYNWLASELKGLYREAYRMALDVCKRAERAFQYERDSDRVFIEPGHWNGSKAGLLAGDRLQMQMQRMEKAYMDTARRDFEIEQTFSLGQLDPIQLQRLRETGMAEFRLPEVAFDLAYPGQYKRRIRSVRLTIPCNAGPYVNVNAKLTQTKSEVRNSPDSDLNDDRTDTESIATSQAKNDSGVFRLRFDGERYVPFEGTGAVSNWRLELPETVRSFDYDTISDVLVHVSYTAREDATLRGNVQDSLRTKLNDLANENTVHRAYQLRQQFSSAFQGLFREGADPRKVEITLDEKHFPNFLRGSTLEVDSLVVALALDDDWAKHYDSSAPLPLTVTAKSDGTSREQSQDLVEQGGEQAIQGLLPHATYFSGSGGATLKAGSTPLDVTLSVAESDLTSLLSTIRSEAELPSDAILKPSDIIDDLILLLKFEVQSSS